MVKQLLLVMLGSALGGGLRYAVGLWLKGLGTLPVDTLAVNVAGCLLIGFVSALPSSHVGPQTRLLLTTGFCGGFTTFSTFANESLTLLGGGHHATSLLYIGLSLGLGLAAVAIGHAAGSALSRC